MVREGNSCVKRTTDRTERVYNECVPFPIFHPRHKDEERKRGMEAKVCAFVHVSDRNRIETVALNSNLTYHTDQTQPVIHHQEI